MARYQVHSVHPEMASFVAATRFQCSIIEGFQTRPSYDAWCKCGPLTALPKCGFKIAALFLAENVYSQLISWRLWHKEQAYEQMVVPQVEFGYPAPLPLTAIEEILEVRTRYTPSALERILAALRK